MTWRYASVQNQTGSAKQGVCRPAWSTLGGEKSNETTLRSRLPLTELESFSNWLMAMKRDSLWMVRRSVFGVPVCPLSPMRMLQSISSDLSWDLFCDAGVFWRSMPAPYVLGDRPS